MKYDIEEIKKTVKDLLIECNVSKAALFGSIVHGKMTDESDIDFLVEFATKKSLFDLCDLKLKLQDVLQKKVDVLTYKSIHPLLKERILREQQVIF